MNLFRKKPDALSQRQGVPNGTFRCDVCGFVQPSIGLSGEGLDAAEGKNLVICGTCALWLGMGTSRLSSVTLFNFSDKQRERITGLKAEMEKLGGPMSFDRQLASMTAGSTTVRIGGGTTANIDKNRRLQESFPHLMSLLKYRLSTLPPEYLDLSARLTHGEPVEPREIKRFNQKKQ
ncbi:MAG: hypothetical protein FWF18_05635 [Dehalococcoidia bacterium]|nr:hypothetical protein [Dehalococcoidia bacterium]